MNNTMISVIVPVFDSDLSLKELIEGIKKNLDEYSFEIILIDDGSSNPKTWQTINKLSYGNVKGIKFNKNFGKHNAILCGFQNAKGKYIITIDDDLEQNPKYIKDLLKYKNHDVVIAEYERSYNFINKIFSNLKHLFDRLIFNKKNKIKPGPLKLINSKILKEIIYKDVISSYITGILCSVTDDIVNIKIKIEKRKYGKSNFNFKKKIIIIFQQIIGFSSWPLKLFTYIGSIGLLSSIILFAHILISLFKGVMVKGWLSIFFGISFFGSINMLLIGIIGLYIFNLNNNISNVKFLIKEKVNFDETK